MNNVLDQVAADSSGTIGNVLSYKAVNAILNGIHSDEWKQYMQYFAQTPAELNRLTFNDTASESDPDVRQNIVYMVAYATCTTITLAQMRAAVDDVVEANL